jgi:glutamate mutase epsilon subunit
MNPFEMVVMIVLIVTIGRVVARRYGGSLPNGKRGAVGFVDDSAGNAEAARLRAEVTRLNDRIQVLERLATDPAKRLSDEIDSLKNQ